MNSITNKIAPDAPYISLILELSSSKRITNLPMVSNMPVNTALISTGRQLGLAFPVNLKAMVNQRVVVKKKIISLTEPVKIGSVFSTLFSKKSRAPSKMKAIKSNVPPVVIIPNDLSLCFKLK